MKKDRELARFHALGKRAAATGQHGVDDVVAAESFVFRGTRYRKGQALPAGTVSISELQQLMHEGKIQWLALR